MVSPPVARWARQHRRGETQPEDRGAQGKAQEKERDPRGQVGSSGRGAEQKAQEVRRGLRRLPACTLHEPGPLLFAVCCRVFSRSVSAVICEVHCSLPHHGLPFKAALSSAPLLVVHYGARHCSIQSDGRSPRHLPSPRPLRQPSSASHARLQVAGSTPNAAAYEYGVATSCVTYARTR